MIIDQVINILMSSTGPAVVQSMRKNLTDARGGNSKPHNTTGKTANSIEATYPVVAGPFLSWRFNANDSAILLNKGSNNVPYGQSISSGGKSQYITALITWCKRKYGLNSKMAKKMAFAVAQAASNRGTLVKNKGWFDEIEDKIFKQIMSDISAIIAMQINQTIIQDLKGNK